MENFGIGPMSPGFVPGRYVVQGIMQHCGKTAESLSSAEDV